MGGLSHLDASWVHSAEQVIEVLWPWRGPYPRGWHSKLSAGWGTPFQSVVTLVLELEAMCASLIQLHTVYIVVHCIFKTCSCPYERKIYLPIY